METIRKMKVDDMPLLDVASVAVKFEAHATFLDLNDRGSGVGRKVAYHAKKNILAFVPGRPEHGQDAPEKLKGIRQVVVAAADDEGLDPDRFDTRGAVQDIGFACHFVDVLIGAIDVFGCVTVAEIQRTEGRIQINTLLVVNSGHANPTRFHRLAWCPLISDGDPGCDLLDANQHWRLSRQLGVTNNTVAEIWNLDEMIGPKPTEMITLRWAMMRRGRVQTDNQDGPIIDMCITPDCNIFACLLLDGRVRLFNLLAGSGQPIKVIQTIEADPWLKRGDYGFISVLDDYSEVVADLDDTRCWTNFIIGRGPRFAVLDACHEQWKVTQKVDLSAALTTSTKVIKDPSGRGLLLCDQENPVSVLVIFNDQAEIQTLRRIATKDVIFHGAFVDKPEKVKIFLLGQTGLLHLESKSPVVEPDHRDSRRLSANMVASGDDSSNLPKPGSSESSTSSSPETCFEVESKVVKKTGTVRPTAPNPIKLSSKVSLLTGSSCGSSVTRSDSKLSMMSGISFDGLEAKTQPKEPSDLNNNDSIRPIPKVPSIKQNFVNRVKGEVSFKHSNESAFEKVEKESPTKVSAPAPWRRPKGTHDPKDIVLQPKPPVEEKPLIERQPSEDATQDSHDRINTLMLEIKEELKRSRLMNVKMAGTVRKAVQREFGKFFHTGDLVDDGSETKSVHSSNADPVPQLKRVHEVLKKVLQEADRDPAAALTMLGRFDLNKLAALDLQSLH